MAVVKPYYHGFWLFTPLVSTSRTAAAAAAGSTLIRAMKTFVLLWQLKMPESRTSAPQTLPG